MGKHEAVCVLLAVCAVLHRARGVEPTGRSIDFLPTQENGFTNFDEERRTEESLNNVDVNGIDNASGEGGSRPPEDELLPEQGPYSPRPSTPGPTTPWTVLWTRPSQRPTFPSEASWSPEPTPESPGLPDGAQGAGGETTVRWSNYPTRTSPSTPLEVRTEPALPPDTTLSTIDGVGCDFGEFPALSLCEWSNGRNTSLMWRAGAGRWANWLGGPQADATARNADGGYVFVETSMIPASTEKKTKFVGAAFNSPTLGSTGPKGSCLSFSYAIKGLSPASFHAVLEDVDINDNAVDVGQRRKGDEGLVLWEAQYHLGGAWQETNLLYNYPTPHRIVLVAVPADENHPSRKYRGHIAVDNVRMNPGSICQGFCTFSAGFCDWYNEFGDDFDWTLSRGSSNPVTGPTMDSSTRLANAGSYAFVDSSFPRRPGDMARLASSAFPPTGGNSPLCMRFWFHMFGPSVGSLRLSLRRTNDDTTVPQLLWSLSGSAGNAWFMGQVSVSSTHEYQLLLEASVGNVGMGDIAVDDITFSQGPCPVSPQVASPWAGDCTFEVDECGWVGGGHRTNIQWERVPTRSQKPRNRRPPISDTHSSNSNNEYFLGLGGRSLPHVGGTARLTSRTFQGSGQPTCLAFWYLMSEPFIDMSGSSLGVLQVFITSERDKSRTIFTPVWQLINNQGITWRYAQIPIKEAANYSIAIEGFWGPNRASGSIAIDDITFYNGDCSVEPLEARVQLEDCSFERGLCGWHNWTRARGDHKAGDRPVSWQKAVDNHRPSQLQDKTFGATDGYIFFDIFTPNQKESAVMIVSSSMKKRESEDSICFTFWYAAFGAGESTHLLVVKIRLLDDPDNASRETLWHLTPEGLDTSRPVWSMGQVSVDATTPFKLVLEGRASNGGFAIDDVRIYPGSCKIRPTEAMPKEKEGDKEGKETTKL